MNNLIYLFQYTSVVFTMHINPEADKQPVTNTSVFRPNRQQK